MQSPYKRSISNFLQSFGSPRHKHHWFSGPMSFWCTSKDWVLDVRHQIPALQEVPNLWDPCHCVGMDFKQDHNSSFLLIMMWPFYLCCEKNSSASFHSFSEKIVPYVAVGLVYPWEEVRFDVSIWGGEFRTFLYCYLGLPEFRSLLNTRSLICYSYLVLQK